MSDQAVGASAGAGDKVIESEMGEMTHTDETYLSFVFAHVFLGPAKPFPDVCALLCT